MGFRNPKDEIAVDSQRGFNIARFRSEIVSRNLLRPNLFHVEFSIPQGLQSGPNRNNAYNAVSKLEFWVESATLPGFIINTYQAMRYGYGTQERRPLSQPLYGEIQFDIIMDQEKTNYDFFYDWMNVIVNTDMRDGPNGETKEIRDVRSVPFELGYRDDYTIDLGIYVYGPNGDLASQIYLREAFPISLGDVKLSWADNNSYMRLPIVIAYTDWFRAV